MIRTLVLAEEHPWPPRGGIALRNAANVAALVAAGPVTVVGVSDPAGFQPPSPLGEHAAVGLGHRPAADVHDRWAEDPDRHPSDTRWSPDADDRLGSLLEAIHPDVVVLEQLWLHRFLATARRASAMVVLDAHNVEGEVYAAVAAAEPPGTDGGRSRELALLMAERTAALEARVASSVDQVWACSVGDQRWFAHAGADAHLVPNVVDVERTPARRTVEPEPLLLYPASFAYPPNVRAARTLIDSILPQVAARVDGACLALVGQAPPRWLRELAASRPDVEVTGAVPSVRPWLERALAVVVPLEEGSGTRFKVLEAMAAGVPVISSPKGVEGLALTPGDNILIGRGGSELAALAVGLAHDASLAAALGANGRAAVRAHYSWSAAAEAIRQALIAVRLTPSAR